MDYAYLCQYTTKIQTVQKPFFNPHGWNGKKAQSQATVPLSQLTPVGPWATTQHHTLCTK
jgi:hypothetical protein